LEIVLGEQVYAGIFAVLALPATMPRQLVCLWYTDAESQEHEVGIVRDLGDWPDKERSLLEQAIQRRYFIRRVIAIDAIRLKYGLLTFRVQTDRGPAEFLMRDNHSQAQDHGPRGKILTDVDDNRFLIEDVEALPHRQQALFRRFIYW
jgi:hypothetical protein